MRMHSLAASHMQANTGEQNLQLAVAACVARCICWQRCQICSINHVAFPILGSFQILRVWNTIDIHAYLWLVSYRVIKKTLQADTTERTLLNSKPFGILRQVVVVLGTGAFACEAMEACLRKGAKHVYLLSRERTRCVYCCATDQDVADQQQQSATQLSSATFPWSMCPSTPNGS